MLPSAGSLQSSIYLCNCFYWGVLIQWHNLDLFIAPNICICIRIWNLNLNHKCICSIYSCNSNITLLETIRSRNACSALCSEENTKDELIYHINPAPSHWQMWSFFVTHTSYLTALLCLHDSKNRFFCCVTQDPSEYAHL